MGVGVCVTPSDDGFQFLSSCSFKVLWIWIISYLSYKELNWLRFSFPKQCGVVFTSGFTSIFSPLVLSLSFFLIFSLKNLHLVINCVSLVEEYQRINAYFSIKDSKIKLFKKESRVIFIFGQETISLFYWIIHRNMLPAALFLWKKVLPVKTADSLVWGLSQWFWEETLLLDFCNVIFHCCEHHWQNSINVHCVHGGSTNLTGRYLKTWSNKVRTKSVWQESNKITFVKLDNPNFFKWLHLLWREQKKLQVLIRLCVIPNLVKWAQIGENGKEIIMASCCPECGAMVNHQHSALPVCLVAHQRQHSPLVSSPQLHIVGRLCSFSFRISLMYLFSQHNGRWEEGLLWNYSGVYSEISMSEI